MKCIICGRESKRQYCPTCYSANHPLLAKIKPFIVRVCKNCGRHFFKNKWVEKPIEDAILQTVKSSLAFSEAKLLASDVEIESIEGAKAVCILGITGLNPGYSSPIAEHYRIEAVIDYNNCDRCNQSQTAYFEAVLQLRHPTLEIERFIDSSLEKDKVHIAHKEQEKDGFDYYLASQHFAQNLGERLKTRFGGTLKITERLFTQNHLTSKLVYRVSIYYEPPQVEPQQVIFHEGKVIKITGAKDKLSGIDLSTGKRLLLKPTERFQKLEVLDGVISKHHPSLEVLSPDTFQSTAVENPRKIEGPTVKIVCHDGKIWIL